MPLTTDNILDAEVMSGTCNSLDLSRELCPMTFVRTKLALDRLSAGDRLAVLLGSAEAAVNVPRAAAEQGYRVLGVEALGDGLVRVTLAPRPPAA
jgi:TusA-related sulfurtransferase